jgi:GDPmannose 4,6-dehydratase
MKNKMTTRRVLITGITGFVGPYLARQLLDAGNEVTGLVRRRADGKYPRRLTEMNILSNISLVHGDVTDLTSILSAIHDVQPDWIFHLAAQSYVPQSFKDPLGTFKINCLGTQNMLEAVRLKDTGSKLIYSGSSEEYGLQFKDVDHFEKMKKKYGGVIEPAPKMFPELPVDEEGNLRPMSPYATSKVYGDYAVRNYHNTYGLDTIVSRAFNHEGAGRGHNFVTSTIIRQIISMHMNENEAMRIGDVQSFRDWSHVEDTVSGYILLAEKAKGGSIYVQGSMRTNSVLSYILYAIAVLGYEIQEIHTIKGEKKIRDPLTIAEVNIGKLILKSNVVDKKMISGELEFTLADEGIVIDTNKRKFKVQFDPARFRSSDVPILLANIEKIKALGFTPKKEVTDIINDQINYYLDPEHRKDVINEN